MDYKRFYAKIDFDAIGNNVSQVRSKIADKTMIMAVIKADGYGHGAVELASYLEDKVDWFGVATIDEALELRRSGCNHPILILGATMPEEFEKAVKNNISVTIFDRERAELLNKEAKKQGKVADVHIKIDTGMSRIGFYPDTDAVETVRYISNLSNVKISGIFSHFARADEADKSSAKQQIELYNKFVDALYDNGVNIPIKHLSNSAGIMELDCDYNMVRMGIMLYGLYPSDEMSREFKLSPAMELISHITYIKTVNKGVGISYGHKFVTDKAMKIATVPVGYADGYPRYLSGKGKVLINGKFCPILGRICMDQMMVDVSHIDKVAVGDDVVLVGASGDEYIGVDDVADPDHSFNYEFVCGISRRVPRIYYLNGTLVKTVSYLN